MERTERLELSRSEHARLVGGYIQLLIRTTDEVRIGFVALNAGTLPARDVHGWLEHQSNRGVKAADFGPIPVLLPGKINSEQDVLVPVAHDDSMVLVMEYDDDAGRR